MSHITGVTKNTFVANALSSMRDCYKNSVSPNFVSKRHPHLASIPIHMLVHLLATKKLNRGDFHV